MIGIKELSKLRGIADSPSAQAGKAMPSTPTSPTATNALEPAQVKKKYAMPEQLDASLVINADTKYDDWGYPIITPKDIKNGLDKARKDPLTNPPQ